MDIDLSTGFLLALSVAGVFALLDWWAVASRHRVLEYVAKPGMTFACVIAVVFADSDHRTQVAWWLSALTWCLIGDIALMLDRWKERSYFLLGLGSFFLGHVSFVIGFLARGVELWKSGIAFLIVGAIAVPLLKMFITGAKARGQAEMVVPLCAYVTVIVCMMSAAVGTGTALAIAGAALFMLSDTLIGLERFVGSVRHQHLAIIVTYHLALIGLVLSVQ